MSVRIMLARLLELGLSQTAIADTCGTTQPTISRAAAGASVGYELGKAIESLLERRERAERRKKVSSSASPTSKKSAA